MFRKIHSKRNPQDTVLSELHKEFKIYFEKISVIITQQLKRNPKLIFSAMVVIILSSAGLSFTLFRNKEPAQKNRIRSKENVIGDGFDQLSATANAIRQTIRLKQQIDSLSSKPALSKADSDILENDLDQLRQLNQHTKP